MIVIDDPRPVWQRPHMGLYWHQMPGGCEDYRKMNFAMFRRGVFDPAKGLDGKTKQQRGALGSVFAGGSRLRAARTAAARGLISKALADGATLQEIAAGADYPFRVLARQWKNKHWPFSDRLTNAVMAYLGGGEAGDDEEEMEGGEQ